MPVTEIFRDRFGAIQTEPKLILRKGQIIQGNIVKLFPHNKAEIQIGAHRLVAELTTSLRAGDSYYFQVQEKDQQIQLKVLSDYKNNHSENINDLARLLGFKPTKSITNLIEVLTNARIPFDKTQIARAVNIIESNGSTHESISLLKKMIRNGLPITENTYQALHTASTESLTKIMTNLLQALPASSQGNETEQILSNLLKQLLMKMEPMPGKQTNATVPNEVMKTLRTLTTMPNINTVNNHYISELIRQLPNNPITNALESIIKNEVELKEQAQNILKHYSDIKYGRLTTDQIPMVTKEIIDHLAPRLPKPAQEVLFRLVNEPTQSNQIELAKFLISLTEDQTYEAAVKEAKGNLNPLSIQRQFISFAQQFITIMGLQDESILKHIFQNNDEPEHLQTIKSHLLSLLSDNKAQAIEKYQPLLHFINGMQLQSVQDTNHLLIATLQLPGEKFSLNEDLLMKFEGKKSEDGKLDPDFCRILFVLNLQNLKETVIDMNIQKRVVTITIYNDLYKNSQVHKSLTQLLDNNLNQLNYQLSSIKWKELHEQKRTKQLGIQDKINHKKGFDYRI